MWIVRDATGRIMHTGLTRAAALRPYRGEAQHTRGGAVVPVARGAWRVLLRRGWTCTRDDGTAELEGMAA